jgi:hypothetical protein
MGTKEPLEKGGIVLIDAHKVNTSSSDGYFSLLFIVVLLHTSIFEIFLHLSSLKSFYICHIINILLLQIMFGPCIYMEKSL